MSSTDKLEAVYLFQCGHCTNDMGHVFRGFGRKKTVFPANVWCMVHRTLGPILFDTGYSDLIYKNGMISRLYNRLNPATVTEDDCISRKLEAHHVAAERVGHIILSHGHPDHMGGLQFFPHARLWVSQGVEETLRSSSLRQLVFKNMAAGLAGRMERISGLLRHPLLSPYFEAVYDIFGDGSVLGVILEGHAKGQLGAYLPSHRLFLGADSAWGADFLAHAERMRPIPRLIQHDFRAYLETTRQITRFMGEHPEIAVVFSHSAGTEGRYEQ